MGKILDSEQLKILLKKLIRKRQYNHLRGRKKSKHIELSEIILLREKELGNSKFSFFKLI